MHILKQELIQNQADLRNIINVLSVVEHLHQPVWKSTTLNPLSELKDLQHGTALLKDCSALLKIYRRSVKRAIKKKLKEKQQKGNDENITS